MARKAGSHAQTTAPKVHDAALRLFARHGFAAVTMRQIAAEVGVQAGALYSYTPDKQSLLFDLMRDHMDRLLTAWRHEDLPVAPVERLDHFTRFHIHFHLARPDAVFIAYMELRNLTPENFAALETLRGAYEAELQDILERGVAAGVFEIAHPKITTRAIIAMLTGLTTWFREDGALSPDEIATIYARMVRGAVGVT